MITGANKLHKDQSLNGFLKEIAMKPIKGQHTHSRFKLIETQSSGSMFLNKKNLDRVMNTPTVSQLQLAIAPDVLDNDFTASKISEISIENNNK